MRQGSAVLTPPVYTNPGASGADYYVKLWCQYSPTHDFNFSVEAAGTSGGTTTDFDQVQYYHTDAIGSVRAITDSAAQLVARYDYLPFGDEWLAPPVQDTRLFAGKERDPETDFDYSARGTSRRRRDGSRVWTRFL